MYVTRYWGTKENKTDEIADSMEVLFYWEKQTNK